MTKILISISFFITAIVLFSDSEMNERLQLQLAYYPDHHRGYNADNFAFPQYDPIETPEDLPPIGGDSGRNLGNGLGIMELQLSYRQSKIYDFFPGVSAITRDNELEAQFITFLSPISFNVETRFILSPVAFFKAEVGGHMGSGWSLNNMIGLSLNESDDGNGDNYPFPGLVLEGWFKGSLQMDTAVFWPGDWHHIQFMTSHEILYQHYTGATFGEAWIYRNDDGQNFNGWCYTGSYVLGYQMPLKLDFAGYLVESKTNVGSNRDISPMDEQGWGSDFMEIRMGPLVHYQISPRNDILFLLQFINAPKYDDETVFYNYFKNRSATGDEFWRLDRLAVIYSFKL